MFVIIMFVCILVGFFMYFYAKVNVKMPHVLLCPPYWTIYVPEGRGGWTKDWNDYLTTRFAPHYTYNKRLSLVSHYTHISRPGRSTVPTGETKILEE